MKEVDWSKAPEEATHWGEEAPIDAYTSWAGCFAQKDGTNWRFYQNGRWGRWSDTWDEEAKAELMSERIPNLIERLVEPQAETLGVYRPDLNTRKLGKVQMELVDTGFPNAMYAIGECMTWAAENKGYKPNDWKNLPNSFMAFTGAASRHRTKRLKGEDLDDESNLLHLAHEAFNILALLETTLLGDNK